MTSEELLIKAAKQGNLEVIKFLIENGANINIYDDLAFRVAAKNGHFEIIKFLVEKGANIHAVDDYPLRWAAKNGHTKVVNYLKSITEKETPQ
jgi:ankyrin repeat protein